MIDAEDKAFVMTWLVRGLAAAIVILSGAGILGAAWRVFDLIRG